MLTAGAMLGLRLHYAIAVLSKGGIGGSDIKFFALA